MKSNEENKLSIWRMVLIVLMLLPVVEVLFALPQLPDQVAVHWGVDGTPDRYGSRFELLFPLLIVLLVGGWMLRSSSDKQPKGVKAGVLLMMLIFNVITPMILYVTFHPEVNINSISFGNIVCGLVSLAVIVAGNYLPKVSWDYRMKYRHGFRTRYALDDEQVWTHTQRFVGYTYMTAGAAGLAGSIFLSGVGALIVFVTAMILANLLGYLYSWKIWKELPENKEKFRQQ